MDIFIYLNLFSRSCVLTFVHLYYLNLFILIFKFVLCIIIMDNVANIFGYGAISNVHYYYYHLVLNIFVITASAFREFRHSMPQLITCFPLVAMLMF